ncbi:unnamed protein product [Sphagnum jensenii]|uniref:Uncharacterized protein n=1 Tax=Sphagnum jensenii TaxID=128206 RepID=A0ABP0X9I4_9BRYO
MADQLDLDFRLWTNESKGSRPLPDYCIHTDLQRLSGLMHDVGYVPCTRFVLHVVEEEELVFQLCHHSKKLAIALGSSTQLLVVLSK